MTRPAHERGQLADRLLDLRQEVNLTQRELAERMGLSAALISSWESGQAVPPEHRLEVYGRFFARARARKSPPPEPPPAEDLSADEHSRSRDLGEELVGLRDDVLRPAAETRRDAGALGGRFWHFPDGQTVTILCTPMSRRQLGLNEDGSLPPGAAPITAYSRRSHPNYVGSLRNADNDALTELVGHIRAENPTIEVRWRAFDQIKDQEELTGHLVILGGADSPPPVPGSTDSLDSGRLVETFVQRLELPIRTRIPEGGDDEFGVEFVVTVDEDDEPVYVGPGPGAREVVYRPRFRREGTEPDRRLALVDGVPQIEFDVALIARQANPLNISARITMCLGGFSRGTYGAIRTFTDARLRTRNERFLRDRVADDGDFWMLVHIPVVGGRTYAPDLERPFHRLRSSS